MIKKNMKPVLLILVLIASIFIAGCITETNNGNLLPSTVTQSPQVTPISPGLYISDADHFQMTIPQTWTASEKAPSDTPSFFLNTVTINNVKLTPMDKELYLSSPDSNVSALITGIEFVKQDGSTLSDTDVLTQFLNGSISAVEQAMEMGAQSAPTKNIEGQQYANLASNGVKFQVVTDPTLHTDKNGNEVELAGINVANNQGEYFVYIEIFVTKYQNRIYFTQVDYIDNAASNPATVTAVSNMLQSFTPIT